MAIIYTYPVKATAAADDLILISDSADSNKTKQVKVSSLPSSGAGGTPSAPLNSVQFNNNSAFGGSANLTFTTNTLAVTHTVDVKGDGANAGKLKLYCENTSQPHAVTIEGPAHSGAAAYTLKLPSPAPTNNQVLEYENSTNNLRWINTPSGGGGGSVDSVQTNNGTYINLTPNSATTGPVTVTADLSAVDGTSVFNTRFLSKDNTWDVISPAGLNTQIQYNNNGSFGSSGNFKYNDSTKVLTIGAQDVNRGIVSIAGGSSGAGELRLGDPGTSGGTVTLKGGNDHSTSYTIKLPDDGPLANNKILQSDASGNLTWINTPTGTTYSAMTTTTLGLGKLRYATGATPAAVAQTTTANRTYGVTENSSNQLVVNVPWTNTDTNTNIANSNLQLDNSRNLDLSDGDASDYTLTFISTLGGSSKNLFKFDQIGGTSPRFTAGHTESAYEGYVVLEGNGSNRTGQVQFQNAAGTYYTSLQAPNTFGANQNIIYTLPNLQGAANSVLTNNGSGTLSWGSVAAVEEGTWTPSAYVPAGSAPTLTTAVGSYIKIGDLVNCYFYLNVTTSSSANVPMVIASLPFSASNTNGYRGMVSMSRNDGTNFIQQQATSGLVTGNQVTLKRPNIQATNPSGTTVSISNTETIDASWYAQATLNYILEGTIIFKV